jgi:glycosyltransferase involved in cell wall biosynthesis
VKVAYLVSRFPAVSETFVLRELDAVDGLPELEVELLSLFPSRDTVVHPAAERWLSRLSRPSRREVARDVAWWLARRPLRLAAAVAVTVAATARRPGVMARSLVALAVACSHARTVRSARVEHVHAHFATYPALAAWLCGRLTGVPYSFTAHAHDIFVHQLMLERKLADAAFAVAISEYNREFLAGLNPGGTPIHVVHCGIDPAMFAFRPRSPEGGGGPVAAICIAGLRESKGHETLLRALAGDGLERIEIDLVGDGPLRGELEALAGRIGLGARLTFLGSRTEAEVRELLDAADLFVLPSVIAADGDMEGIPVALMEALASGAITIASRMSGIPELVRDGETGILAEPGDTESLRSALVRALGGEAGVDPAAARRLVEREFDVQASAERLRDLFLEL